MWNRTVTANWLKSHNGTLFSHVWRRGRLALDPLQNKSCSEFFSQAYKNWHITWGNNLGPDWPPLAKGSQISHYHTPTRPLNFFPLDNRRIWAYRFNHNNINIVVVGNSGFPCDTLGINRDNSKQDNIRRIEAEKKAWSNNIDHMVTWKYIKSFTTYIYTFRVSKHIIGQSTSINVFSWLLSFFELRERESGKGNLGTKEKCPQSYWSYFRRGSTGESFFFHGLIDFVLFLVLAWRIWSPSCLS